MKRKMLLIAFILFFSIAFAGCSSDGQGSQGFQGSSSTDGTSSLGSTADMFTERDCEIGYNVDESVKIELNGSTATCQSGNVKIEGSTVTILDEGTYIISGNLNDGMIVVDAEENDKPQLVLDDVSINNVTSAALYILESDKVFITLAEGSNNSLSNGGSFVAIDENNIDGTVFSKQDIVFNGKGTLSVSSPAGHGIVAKDDFKITSGTYDISASSHGVDANDSIRIAGGDITMDVGNDGLHAENTDEDGLGYIYILNGKFDITSADDAIHAEETLVVIDGKITINESYEGLEALNIEIYDGDINIKASDDGINAAGGKDSSGFGGVMEGPGGKDMGGGMKGPGNKDHFGGGMSEGQSNGSVLISGGKIYIEALGDGIDSNGTLDITGGYVEVCGPTNGDTAVLDYDSTGIINGGTFVGTGAYMMAQSLDSDKQGVLAVSVGSQSGGTTIEIVDESGKVIASITPSLSYQILIYSSPDIVKGEIYTLNIGNISGQVEAY